MSTASPAAQFTQWPRSPAVPYGAYDDDIDDYLSEDEVTGSQGGPSTAPYTSSEEIGRHTYLPTVLGFSADDRGTEDWKEMRAGMKAKERAMPPKATFNEEYTKRRSVLVDWMSQTSETVLELVPLTIHMAVAFLDAAVAKLGDQYIKPTRLQLMATACILAAAKMEENDGRVPSVYELNHCCQNGYSPQLIVKMESLLLDLLDWNLVVLTPRHFLELYEGGGALVVQPFEEFFNNSTISPHKVALLQGHQQAYAAFFVDLCLHDFNFVHYRPSIVAAAALASARRMLKMTPIWPRRLAKLTQYDFEHFAQCAEHIWAVYERTLASP